MESRKPYLLMTLMGGLLLAAVRFMILRYGVDESGLPISAHPTVIAYLLVGIFLLLLFLRVSRKVESAEEIRNVFAYSGMLWVVACLGGGMVLLGTVEDLLASGVSGLVLFFLGVAAAISMVLSACGRKGGKSIPPAELLPVVYLVIKLIVNFKSWSTDPIILDYCDLLFGLCFVLLAFYYSAGFCLGAGAPRRTLFCSGVAIMLSASSIVTELLRGSGWEALGYFGYLLWLVPVVACLEKNPEGKTE